MVRASALLLVPLALSANSSVLPPRRFAPATGNAVGQHDRPASLHEQFHAAQKRQAPANGSFWLESIDHQGVAPYAPDGYEVFRNVKDFGAKGMQLLPVR